MRALFQLSVPWWEFVVRGVVVYLFLLVFLRLTGRRQIGQYDPFYLILLLILSNAVQNSMNAGDNSLIGGLISALTLIGCHALMSWLTWGSARLARWIDGRPRVLIRAGERPGRRACGPARGRLPAHARGAARHHRDQRADHGGAAQPRLGARAGARRTALIRS